MEEINLPSTRSTVNRQSSPKKARSKNAKIDVSSMPQRETVPLPTEKRGFPTAGKIILGAVILGVVVFLAKGLFLVALVNGQPITRFAVIQQLESQGGKQVSSSLITQALITQGFAKKHITVSQQEIDVEIKRISNQIKQQGGTLEQLLAAQGETQKTFADRVKIQLMAQKLFANQMKVTDSEVQSYIDNNKQDPAIVNTSDQTVLKTQIRTQLGQQKLRDAFQSWVAQLQKTSSIIRFVNY